MYNAQRSYAAGPSTQPHWQSPVFDPIEYEGHEPIDQYAPSTVWQEPYVSAYLQSPTPSPVPTPHAQLLSHPPAATPNYAMVPPPTIDPNLLSPQPQPTSDPLACSPEPQRADPPVLLSTGPLPPKRARKPVKRSPEPPPKKRSRKREKGKQRQQTPQPLPPPLQLPYVPSHLLPQVGFLGHLPSRMLPYTVTPMYLTQNGKVQYYAYADADGIAKVCMVGSVMDMQTTYHAVAQEQRRVMAHVARQH